MFTPIDKFLYSDTCTIVKIGTEYIFPIYKNGSSSLFRQCREVNGIQIHHSELRTITDNITVIVREPAERFKSGLATVIYNLKMQHPELDSDTIEFLLKRYRYLDTHYVPQFHWILNLSRFINPEVKLHLKPMTYLEKITSLNETALKKDGLTVNDELLQDLYLQLDTILYNQIGKKITFKEIVYLIKNDEHSGYNDITHIPFALIELLK
jgi:hypothetical protein